MTPTIAETGFQIDKITRLRVIALAANLRTLSGYSPMLGAVVRLKDTNGVPIETDVSTLVNSLEGIKTEVKGIENASQFILDVIAYTGEDD